MRTVRLVLLLRLALFAGAAASMVLLLDSANRAGLAFCDVGSGCMAVRRWSREELGPISLPQIGLVAFLVLLALSLFARSRPYHAVIAVLTGIGGVAAVGLLVLQAAAIGAFCSWCVTVDIAWIVAGIAAFAIHRTVSRRPEATPWFEAFDANPLIKILWGAVGGIAALGLPLLWARYPTIPKTPPELASFAVPGKVNIISFTDFECPFCRDLHPHVEEVERKNPDRVHLTRLMMPLERHPGAMPGALAYECTPEAKRDEMANRLYGSNPDALTREGTTHVAEELGLERAAFEACLDKPETRAAVDADVALFKRIGGMGVPLTYVNNHLALGPQAFEAEVELALQNGEATSLPVWGLVVALGIVGAFLSGVTLRLAPEEERVAAKNELK